MLLHSVEDGSRLSWQQGPTVDFSSTLSGHLEGTREVTCFHCEWDVVWQVEKFSIIQVQDCICNVVQNRRIVVLLNVEVCSRFMHIGIVTGS